MVDQLTGTLIGLAYGDAVGFPSLFHRFHVLPAKRHDFLFNTNRRLSHDHILPLALPFTHRQSEDTLAPGPTDDTEYAVFTLKALLAGGEGADVSTLLAAWRTELAPKVGEIWTRFSERAALENLNRGLSPPQTGTDNPLHYEDAAVSRAVAIGLFFAGNPAHAAAVAGEEAAFSQAEDGIWGAQAAASVVAAIVGGTPLDSALDHASSYFPEDSWIAHESKKAQECLDRATSTAELPLLLSRTVINNVYSFGNLAPETVPAAFAIVRAFKGDLSAAVASSALIAKSADSLPALVGAICGAASGSAELGRLWHEQLDTIRGCCLPFLSGTRLSEVAAVLKDRLSSAAKI